MSWALLLISACDAPHQHQQLVAADAWSPKATDAPVGDPGPDLHWSGIVRDQDGVGIEGATVCVLRHPEIPCETTDAAGSYATTIPATLRQFSVQATAMGYLGEVRLESDPLAASPPVHGWPGYFTLYSATMAMQQFGAAVPTNGMGLALVRITTITGGDLAGATATSLPPATGLYFDAQGRLDPSLTATTTADVVMFGALAPGTFTVTAFAPGKTCTALTEGSAVGGDWPPANGGTTDLDIAADCLTDQVQVLCQDI